MDLFFELLMKYNSMFVPTPMKSYDQWVSEFEIPFEVEGKSLYGNYQKICDINEKVCIQYNTRKLYYDYKQSRIMWDKINKYMLMLPQYVLPFVCLFFCYTVALTINKHKFRSLFVIASSIMFAYYFKYVQAFKIRDNIYYLT